MTADHIDRAAEVMDRNFNPVLAAFAGGEPA